MIHTDNQAKRLPVILALDVEDKTTVLALLKQTKHCIPTYKIGPRLFLKEGPALLQEIKKLVPQARIFLDFKFYDIPSSTVAACCSAFEMGANYVTVHARLNLHTLKELYELEKSFNLSNPPYQGKNLPENLDQAKADHQAGTNNQTIRDQAFRVLCVTVLSSEGDSKDTKAQVLALADKVYQSGLSSLVCSPLEAPLLKNKYPDSFLVTPGIRLSGDPLGDQKRVMGPSQALKAGSSALVIGRSLTQCDNLEQKLQQLTKELEGG